MNELKTALQKARTLWKINAIMEIAVDGITALSPAQIEELKALATARKLDIELKQGVYCQLTGPTFESPAEVRMLGILGADAVGMSTACEAAAARHAGVRVCGISCITNQAAGISETPLSHQEVFDVANRVAPLFRRLVRESILAIGEDCL